MNKTASNPTSEIKKLQVKETILFAINHIPQVDRPTLEKFLELINSTGAFGSMSHEQIVTKMALTVKYVPGACAYSLLVLVDLLELQVPNIPPILTAPSNRLISPGTNEASGFSYQIEANSSAHV